MPRIVDEAKPRPISGRSRVPAAPAPAQSDGRTKPKLLLLITLAEVGGAQTYVAQLLPGLVDEFDVVVAAHGDGPLVDAARGAGARYVPLEWLRRPVHPLRDLAGLAELVRLFRRERPDIVHANSSKAGVVGRIAAVLARVPSRVFTVHGWAFAQTTSRASRVLYLALDRLLCPFTSLVVCVSHDAHRLGLRERTCREERSVVIWNAVDVAAAPRAPLDGKPPVFVSVARLAAPKDLWTLLEAVALLPEGSLELQVVGDGPDRAALEHERNRLGLERTVSFLGNRTDVSELLSRADGFVLSSTTEGLPISVIEAMAAGLPVVSSDVGGVPELVVDGETGLLMPPRRPAELAAALSRLAADPDLRRRLGAGARERAEACFDLPGFRSAHLDAYRSLVSQAGVRARRPAQPHPSR